MSRYPVGQPVRLKTTVTDPATGAPTDPGGISLVLQRPDLSQSTYTTVSSPAVVRDSVGAFHLDFTAALTGRHAYYWSTTGTAAGSTPAAGFDVVDPLAPAHISFEDARARLNLTAASDAEVQDMIASAIAEQEQRVGPVAPRTVTETVTAYGGRLALSARPVLSLTSALASEASASIAGWSVPSPMAGLVQSATTLSGAYTVTYVAGRNPVPPDLVEAALLRVQASYETQRGPAGLPLAAEQDAGFGSSYPLLLRAQDKERPYVLPVIA